MLLNLFLILISQLDIPLEPKKKKTNKKKQTPYPALLKKVRIKSWIHLFIRISTKSSCGLFWAKIQPPSKLCGNPVTLQTNQPTNHQMDTDESITTLEVVR